MADDLYCRGPVNMTGLYAGGSEEIGLWIRFRKNPAAAGKNGASLGPGAGAFADRVLTAAEPVQVRVATPTWEDSMLTVPVPPTVDASGWTLSILDRQITLISQLLTRADFVVVLMVEIAGKHFDAEVRTAPVRYIPFVHA